jgi:membrane protease YdiL (CAAX protease family)
MPTAVRKRDETGPTGGKSLAIFLAVAFGFSWAQWIGAIASSRGWIPFRVPLTPFGSFGPALGAIAALVASREPGAARRWAASIVRWRGLAWTALAACLFPPAAAAVAFVSAAAITGVRIPPKLPGVGLLLAASFEILLVGGPLGEEPGWRGFLLVRLRRSMGATAATLSVAAIWLAWHVPLFFVPGSAQAGIPFPAFALSIAAEAFLLTWLFESAGDGTLVAVLAHTAFNVTFLLAARGILERHQNDLFWPIYLALLAAAALLVWRKSSVFRGRPAPAFPDRHESGGADDLVRPARDR